jgi:engulfment/cell motility protein 1
LRDKDTDELIVNENLRKKIKNKVNLKCAIQTMFLIYY